MRCYLLGFGFLLRNSERLGFVSLFAWKRERREKTIIRLCSQFFAEKVTRWEIKFRALVVCTTVESTF